MSEEYTKKEVFNKAATATAAEAKASTIERKSLKRPHLPSDDESHSQDINPITPQRTESTDSSTMQQERQTSSAQSRSTDAYHGALKRKVPFSR